MDNVKNLIEILPFVQEFRGKLFVVKVGGAAVADAKAQDGIARDISALSKLGMKIVLVHGGGPQADELLGRMGKSVKKIGGRRITDKDALDVAKMVYRGRINSELVSALEKWGSQAIGISGIECGTVIAKKRELKKVRDEATGKEEDVDYGFVGDIVKVNPALMNIALENGIIPVVAPLSSDGAGGILNTNADGIACAIAKELHASKMIIMTDVPGVLENKDNPMAIISYMSVDDALKFSKSGNASGGMLPKLDACIAAIQGGVERAHIIDGRTEHSLLLEVFTNQGCGTMIDAGKK